MYGEYATGTNRTPLTEKIVQYVKENFNKDATDWLNNRLNGIPSKEEQKKRKKRRW